MVVVSFKGKELIVDSNIGGVVRAIQDNISEANIICYGFEEALLMLDGNIVGIRESKNLTANDVVKLIEGLQ